MVSTDMRYHETLLPQQLRGEALQRLNALTVADALRHMSGLQLKDYGGLGGIKTINIRSMGSQHVGIYYDGIELGNAQNGQIDLGQLSLDNVEELSVYNGQRSSILQTASDYANAGSVYIRTKTPATNRLRAKLQAGSSLLARLSLLLERKLTQNVTVSLNAEAMSSNGRYSFRYRRLNYDHSVAYDTTATRENDDIQALRAEMNLMGHSPLNDRHWSMKAYTYHSSRGIPGAIVNNVWRRGERQSDHNTWLQGSYQQEVTDRYTLRMAGKYAYYASHYQNRDTTTMLIDQHYRQQDGYLTTTHVLAHTEHWSTSASYDLRWNWLESDKKTFDHPSRLSQLAALATAIDYPHWQAQASLVYTHVSDRASDKHNTTQHWTPALFLSYTPLHDRKALQLKAFAKKSFRMPTFNELYYTEIGNASLKPESATQYDLGAEWQHSWPNCILWSAGFDCYHNEVRNKIVAYPKGQQFRWTMLNLGHVRIDGIDLHTEASFRMKRELTLGARMQYTWQSATDVTDPSSSYYQDQIPYIPWHSGSATLLCQWREWDLHYSFIYTGRRYCQQENIRYNEVQPWYTSDLGLNYQRKGKEHRHSKTRNEWKISLQVNNLLNQQYDVIINYPMPGRNYLMTLQWNL